MGPHTGPRAAPQAAAPPPSRPVIAPWALGTDTGGSIRQPAALCGIVGLKPTYGACSRYGMIAFASSLDQAGPLTRDVTDAALIFRHMVGRDRRDSTSLEFPGEIAAAQPEDLKGIRLGVPEELTGAEGGIEPGVRENFEATLALAQGLGATVEPCRLPHAPHALSAYYLIAPAEASPTWLGSTASATGCGSTATRTWSRCTAARARWASGAEVKRRIMLGTYALSSGYYDAYYGTAQKVRTKIADDFGTAFERFDFIVTPTSPWTAFELGAKTRRPACHVPERLPAPSRCRWPESPPSRSRRG